MGVTPISVAQQLLADADEILNKRAAERDVEQERSMEGIVEAFNALTGRNLTESEGWLFMAVLKLKRSLRGRYRPDDYVDGAAYVALYGESKKNEDEINNPPLPPMPV